MKRDEDAARAIAAVFAEAITPRIKKMAVDTVVPVPLHWMRRWHRGYNQVEVLAQALADALRVTHRPRLLRRTRPTPFQTSLTPTARRENVRGAFAARYLRKDLLVGRTILVVDDVFTTGATVNAATIALRHAGAKDVHIAVVAHG